jgi:hypothetical protein
MKSSLWVLLFVGSAAAADEPASSVPQELHSCAAINRNPERLACYDRAVAALIAGKASTGTSSGATPEATFGVISNARGAPAPSGAEQKADLQSLTAKVKGFGRGDDGSLLIQLDNGQTWRQLSGSESLLKVGDAVTINRAALGSFQMVMPSGRSAKVRRIS